MNMTTLLEMLDRQYRLQIDAFEVDPCKMSGETQAEFIRWNLLAAEDELHEALAEVNWKPWATADAGVRDRDAYTKELVDAWHFIMNMLLTAYDSPAEAAEAFAAAYFKKADVNAKRQADGYTGLRKCPNCHRDEDEAGVVEFATGAKMCMGCGWEWNVIT